MSFLSHLLRSPWHTLAQSCYSILQSLIGSPGNLSNFKLKSPVTSCSWSAKWDRPEGRGPKIKQTYTHSVFTSRSLSHSLTHTRNPRFLLMLFFVQQPPPGRSNARFAERILISRAGWNRVHGTSIRDCAGSCKILPKYALS